MTGWQRTRMKISPGALMLAATFTAFFAPFYILSGYLASRHVHFYFFYYLLTKYSLASSNGVLNFFGGFSLGYSALSINNCASAF